MNLTGVLPPITTPFDTSDHPDTAALRRNIQRYAAAGVAGIVALGSNGEAPQLDDSESDEVIAAAREATPASLTLVAGTARESTRGTIDACRRAAGLGADAVLVRTPSYFRHQMTHDAFVRHYTAVADASPVPVVLYNFTNLTAVDLTPDTVAALAAHPNVAGVKESGGDVGRVVALADVARSVATTFTVLVGAAPAFHASLCAGATGGILALACVAPEACVAIHRLATGGRHAEAAELQRLVTPLAALVTSRHGVPGLKLALDVAGYDGGPPRPPLLPAPSDAAGAIRAELARVRERLDVTQPETA